jgi:hypothetical protein
MNTKLTLGVSQSKTLLNKSTMLIAGVVQSVCRNDFVGESENRNSYMSVQTSRDVETKNSITS